MDAWILDAVRTPRGKGKPGGALHSVKPVALLKPLYQAIAERNHLDTSLVDDILLGCVTATGEQGANIAKISALYAGWSDHISGATVNRFCASGLDALHSASAKLATGMADLMVAGGVESLSRVPMFSDGGAWFQDKEVARATGFIHMGVSADLLATMEGIPREAIDAYAAESHRRAATARDAGRFARSLIPVSADGKVLLDRDENIRDDTTPAKLGVLPAAFAEMSDAVARERYPGLGPVKHVHTVGSAPALADAASLLLLGTHASAQRIDCRPRARVLSFADVSVEPVLMLSGNIGATRKAVQKAGLSIGDIDLFEVNESFGAVVLQYRKALGLAADQINVNGGAIALGHPLGATGGILIATLLDELERRGLRYGVASICAGAGIAAATVIERV